MVIPAIDTINEVLATSALSSKYSLAIHAALSVGKKTLNRYYLKTDLSNTYWIAMGTCSCFFIFASGGSLRTMKYISTCFTLGHRDCETFSERTGGGFRGYYTLETLRKPLSAQTVTLTPQRG